MFPLIFALVLNCGASELNLEQFKMCSKVVPFEKAMGCFKEHKIPIHELSESHRHTVCLFRRTYFAVEMCYSELGLKK